MKELVLLLQEYYDDYFLTAKQIIEIVKGINDCFPDNQMMIDIMSQKYIIIYYKTEIYAITFANKP